MRGEHGGIELTPQRWRAILAPVEYYPELKCRSGCLCGFADSRDVATKTRKVRSGYG